MEWLIVEVEMIVALEVGEEQQLQDKTVVPVILLELMEALVLRLQ
jgi:hypothetical protein